MVIDGSTTKTIQLSDGRTLGYAEYGHAEGKPLFYFHGHPGARLEARFLENQAVEQGIRLIGVDRPGLGLSTYLAGRCLLDWPRDICELADQLNIDRFSVVGFSGGGPYALACAFQIPDRLVACGVVAGVGHLNPVLAFLSQWAPFLILPLTSRFLKTQDQAEKLLVQASRNWVEPDRKSLLVPGVRELMAASLVESQRQGARGAALDGAILGRSWGFQLEDMKAAQVYLWHGELDKEVSVAAGREVAHRLPQCKATFYPDEGHISTIVNHAIEIMASFSS